MPGFVPLTLSAAYVLAALSGCPQQGTADIEVRVQKTDNAYITNLSSHQLTQAYGNDPDSTLSTDGNWMVGGVTVVSGDGLQAQTKAQFSFTPDYRTNTACFTITKVEYEIRYSPRIYIASDFLGMGCRYSATLMHEKRHVAQDMKTLTDFEHEISRAIQKHLSGLPPQGPFPHSGIEQIQQRALKALQEALEPIWKDLLELRRKRQAEIDTEANYRRDTALCPGQFPEFGGGG